jgi:hypothetical protein
VVADSDFWADEHMQIQVQAAVILFVLSGMGSCNKRKKGQEWPWSSRIT